LPANLSGTVKVLRNGKTVWSGNLLSGEDNMCHSIENLEHHHFKYRMFRRPGDVHVHFFGASLLSCQDGFRTEPHDVVEIESEPFGRPLRNPLIWSEEEGPVTVRKI
jgi:hypothetical protein